MEQANAQITASVVPANRRLNALPRHFGDVMMKVEGTIFDTAGKYAPDYNSAMWEFYDLSNGGFFMAPAGQKRIRVCNALNHFDAEMSAEAAGIAFCLMAYSALAYGPNTDRFLAHYDRLDAYASQHPERVRIKAFLD